MKKDRLISALSLVLAATLVFSFSSCDKDSGDEPQSVSKTGLLTSSGWIMKSFVQETSIGDLDLYDLLMDDCSKDDIFKFNTDTVLIDEGATKCDPSDPQTSSGGSWELISNDTKIILDGDTFDIRTLSSTDFKIALSEYDPSTQQTSTNVLGFKH